MSMRGKHHQHLEKEKPDVMGPRSKLEGVLQNLVERAEEESHPDEIELGPIIKKEVEDSEHVELASPAKRPNRSRKRRKRELPSENLDNETIDAARLQHSYVMKVFDRSVDLAQFRTYSALYPVCREWMQNKPATQRGSRDRSQSPEPLDDSDENSQPPLYRLPGPSKLASYMREESGQDPRVPLPMPNQETLDILISSQKYSMGITMNSPSYLSKDELLMKNMDRWKTIRHSWKSSAQYNQARYNESYAILKAMYERQ